MKVIAEDFDKLSILGNKIVQKANEYGASSNYDYKTIEKIKEINANDKIHKNFVRNLPEGLSLMVGIIEIESRSNVLGKIRTMLKYSSVMNPWFRGKHIINIIKNIDIDLEPIFQLALSWDFIDVVVVEWDQMNFNNKTMGSLVTRNKSEVFVYSYDPFNEILSKRIVNAHFEPILEEVKNFGGYPLTVCSPGKPPFKTFTAVLNYREYKRDLQFLELLTEAMNCNIISTCSPISSIGESYNMDANETVLLERWVGSEIELPIKQMSDILDETHDDVDLIYTRYHQSIYIPRFIRGHFYFRRRKIYEKSISFAAIMTFGGLIYTAWIFAIWSRLLGFKQRNWNFLNILTAQMGGSIEHDGPMKLSEMVFQMSIYVSTFLIVTLGADYMYEIFLLHQKLPEIKTLRDLADANIELIMSERQYDLLQRVSKDDILERIFNQTKSRMGLPMSTTIFCSPPYHTVDEKINLCMLNSRFSGYFLKSNNEWQVNKIEDSIFIMMPSLKLIDPHIRFIKNRMQKLITRFSETGLLDSWWKEFFGAHSFDDVSDSLTLKITKDDEIPLESQLWPVLLVGYSVGFVALIGEFIWKRYISKTRFGKLLIDFYHYARMTPNDYQTRKNILLSPHQIQRMTQMHKVLKENNFHLSSHIWTDQNLCRNKHGF
ncbi:hypothetical protein QAD02_004940 [Eretmocerus hayati]|uniref:Uncharacterized protein n=1 Tax=Eretmocerus hayati TaxID=131215 RepID=A0ACC2NS38_9HYME|nr:hypothetical protein QAD02_004940 [Eretmocerus hayati]